MKSINKKNIPYIIIGIVTLIILIIVIIIKTTSSSISTFELKKDTYISEDYNNDIIYENTIYVPDYMTRLIQTKKGFYNPFLWSWYIFEWVNYMINILIIFSIISPSIIFCHL